MRADGDELFTVWLKEYFDQDYMAPTYEDERVSGHIPKFKTTVTVGGIVGHGSGGSKKESKHKASKEACQVLMSLRRMGNDGKRLAP
jgi:dsRNA-specific ribonuclease